MRCVVFFGSWCCDRKVETFAAGFPLRDPKCFVLILCRNCCLLRFPDSEFEILRHTLLGFVYVSMINTSISILRFFVSLAVPHSRFSCVICQHIICTVFGFEQVKFWGRVLLSSRNVLPELTLLETASFEERVDHVIVS